MRPGSDPVAVTCFGVSGTHAFARAHLQVAAVWHMSLSRCFGRCFLHLMRELQSWSTCSVLS